MKGKIAIEEHYNISDYDEALPVYVDADAKNRADIRARLLDVSDLRLQSMDEAGIDYSVLSLTSPCITGFTDPSKVIAQCKNANDGLAEVIAVNPTRFGGFAMLPMQDPAAAVVELERCVKDLGFPAVMLNGYTNYDDVNSAYYYDHERFWPVWERAEELGVPFYLHPRDPLPSRMGWFEGHPELLGATWAFIIETATHTLRLMGSGVFDRFPKLKFILGHMGETLPFTIWRIDHRLSYLGDMRKFNQTFEYYLKNNIYITTSGYFSTKALTTTINEVGAERVLFATDYPYETMQEAGTWFDNAEISEDDRIKIGRSNTQQLFKLDI